MARACRGKGYTDSMQRQRNIRDPLFSQSGCWWWRQSERDPATCSLLLLLHYSHSNAHHSVTYANGFTCYCANRGTYSLPLVCAGTVVTCILVHVKWMLATKFLLCVHFYCRLHQLQGIEDAAENFGYISFPQQHHSSMWTMGMHNVVKYRYSKPICQPLQWVSILFADHIGFST